MDIGALGSALQGLHAVSEMLKAGYSVRNVNEVSAKVSDVYA
jgi:hypothetical protein